MKKNILLPLILIVVLMAGGTYYLGYHKSPDSVEKPVEDTEIADGENGDIEDENNNSEDTENKSEAEEEATEELNGEKDLHEGPEVAPPSYEKGEIVVEGAVETVDEENRILIFQQHIEDSNTVEVDSEIKVREDAVIVTREQALSLEKIEAGDIVNIILTEDREARAIEVYTP